MISTTSHRLLRQMAEARGQRIGEMLEALILAGSKSILLESVDDRV